MIFCLGEWSIVYRNVQGNLRGLTEILLFLIFFTYKFNIKMDKSQLFIQNNLNNKIIYTNKQS